MSASVKRAPNVYNYLDAFRKDPANTSDMNAKLIKEAAEARSEGFAQSEENTLESIFSSVVPDPKPAYVNVAIQGQIVSSGIGSSPVKTPVLNDHWKAAADIEGVPSERQPELLEKIRLEVARIVRPKWADRLDYKALRTLTAPQFLKTVHGDEIDEEGHVSTRVIRDLDPPLMRAVEMYVSQRKGRNVDLGDATDLNFVMERAPRATKAGDFKPL